MNINWLRRLTTPLRYLKIKHKQKVKYDWVIPGILTLLCMWGLSGIGYSVSLTGEKGMLAGIATLAHVLVGFFIAALAAVATFQGQGMDEKMSSPSPTLKDKYKGQTITRELTRRQFLCFLFGYLAFVSLFIALLTIFERVLGTQLAAFFPELVKVWIRPIGLAAILFIFWNLFVTTLVGLYYLTDRIHQVNPEIKS